MGVDDDSKETNVSPTAANTLFNGDLIEPVKSPALQNLNIVNAESEDLGSLFRNHYKGMFRVAYRITGSPSDAEDVLQNVFMRLTPDWESRDLSPNPRGFLY